jgi:hypothetical protein
MSHISEEPAASIFQSRSRSSIGKWHFIPERSLGAGVKGCGLERVGTTQL